jgi:hypothetical protein
MKLFKNENNQIEFISTGPKREMDLYPPTSRGESLNTTEENISIVGEVFKAFNTGDITKVNS